jgi:hypothetical protein
LRVVAACAVRRHAGTELSYVAFFVAVSSRDLRSFHHSFNPWSPTMPTTRRNDPDACSFLDIDHRHVKKMFKAFGELANEICMELKAHTQIEEEIFYPALRQAIKETDLLDEAEVEHASAKELIAQILDATDIDEKFDAKVIVLGEYIDHHVKEERNEIFGKARAAHGRKLESPAVACEGLPLVLSSHAGLSTIAISDRDAPERRELVEHQQQLVAKLRVAFGKLARLKADRLLEEEIQQRLQLGNVVGVDLHIDRDL